MSFKIKDYVEIVSEIQSEWTAICPCCKTPKLKIKKENNAYICVNTPQCTTEEIRAKLGRKKMDTFKYVPYLEPLSLINSKTDLKLGKITDIQNIEIPVKNNNKTIYKYNDFFIIERIDISKKKKVFYPYFKVDNNWVKSSEVPNKLNYSSFYREDLLLPHELTLVVEGEKCTDFVISNLGLKCITPPGFGWSVNWLKEKLQNLQTSGIIIVPDHDKVGLEKAYMFQRVAWELKIPCSVVLMFNVLSDTRDIADLDIKSQDLIKVKEQLLRWI